MKPHLGLERDRYPSLTVSPISIRLEGCREVLAFLFAVGGGGWDHRTRRFPACGATFAITRNGRFYPRLTLARNRSQFAAPSATLSRPSATTKERKGSDQRYAAARAAYIVRADAKPAIM